MSKKSLRYYQRDCITAIKEGIKLGYSELYANLFTGLGKSLVIADMMQSMVKRNKRVVTLVPRLELVKQNYKEAFDYFDADLNKSIGICCNKLDKMQYKSSTIIAMYQSIASIGHIKRIGAIDFLIIDECHLVNSDEKSQLRRIISEFQKLNPKLIVIGLTATHYRVGEGQLHEDSIYGKAFFKYKAYDSTIEPGLKRLIDEGYLADIEILCGATAIDTDGIKKTKTDFNQKECQVKFSAIVESAVKDIKEKIAQNNIKSSMVFVSNVTNGEEIVRYYGNDKEIRMISGKNTEKEQNQAIEWLKNGTGTRILVNCELYTTGFNYNDLEAIFMLRATISLGLLVQIIGRLTRPKGGKKGYFVDYGTNIDRLMPDGLTSIKAPAPKLKLAEAQKKQCLIIECGYWNHQNAVKCVECGAYFNHDENNIGLYSMMLETNVGALVERQKQIDSREVINITFFDMYTSTTKKGGVCLIARYHYLGSSYKKWLMFDSDGKAKGMSKDWLQKALVNFSDYLDLEKNDMINCENINALWCENPELFKEPKSIIIQDQLDNPKYKEIYEIVY